MELALQVQLVLLVELVDAPEDGGCLRVLEDHLLLQRGLRPEGVLLVAAQGRTPEEVALRADQLLVRLLFCEVHELLLLGVL